LEREFASGAFDDIRQGDGHEHHPDWPSRSPQPWKPELSDPFAPVAGFVVEVRYGHDPHMFGQADIDDSIQGSGH